MRLRHLFVAGFGLAAGFLILALWMTPRITTWAPSDDRIRARQNISLTANTPIEEGSIGSHFQSMPPIAGTLRLDGRSIDFDPFEPLEYGNTYTITISPGLKGENGLSSLSSAQHSFTVQAPELVFMREIDGLTNLWQRDKAGSMSQFSFEPLGIWDYSILPDGSGVLLSSLDDDGSEDLVSILSSGERTEVLDCQDHRCRDARWQPEGSLIAFERSGVEGNGSAEVWILDTATRSAQPAHGTALFDDLPVDDASSRFPRWSSDGRYLSYYKPNAQSIVVLDMFGDQPQLILANVDAMGEWSPSGYQLAFTRLNIDETHEESSNEVTGENGEDSSSSISSAVTVADIEASNIINLSQGGSYLEGVPEWGPVGGFISSGRITEGTRQIWTIPLEDGLPEMLTGDPFYDHTSPSWSPDGSRLAFMRSKIDTGGGYAGLWLLDPGSGEVVLVADDAFVPGWLP
jgi:dipeptidyl aminopeptidase/acylaminoacyl peptidase